MYNIEQAQASLVKLKEEDNDLSVLTSAERQNLVDMLDTWWESQGWDLAELKAERLKEE